MTAITKGASVRTLKQGYGFRPSAPDIWFRKGDELQVVHVRKDARLKVKHIRDDRDGGEFLIAVEDVDGPLRPLGEVPEGSISADDPRLDWLWEDAERVADISGFCEEYDRLLKTLRLPGRLRTHTVKMAAADGIEIVARVKARSLRQAEERLRQQMNAHAINDMSIGGADVVLATLEEAR